MSEDYREFLKEASEAREAYDKEQEAKKAQAEKEEKEFRRIVREEIDKAEAERDKGSRVHTAVKERLKKYKRG